MPPWCSLWFQDCITHGRFQGAVALRRPTDWAQSKLAADYGLLRFPGSSTSSATSAVSAFSSISISRNSSESKTSPHSRHSTYSVSSCRETIRTLGCLQMVAITSESVAQNLFPPDCSGLLHNFERVFVETPLFCADFMRTTR